MIWGFLFRVMDSSLGFGGSLRILGFILLVIILFFAVINIIPPKKNVADNPFIVGKGNLPMIAAHRGGGDNNPENTLLAFREAVETVRVDIIESDLYLTKDGYLVYNHDSYIDETCNINGDLTLDEVEDLCDDRANRHYIEDMTLAELQQYNFGYYFENKNGERIYKDVTDIESLGKLSRYRNVPLLNFKRLAILIRVGNQIGVV